MSTLVQAAVAAAMCQSEKERLQKKKETTEALLRKARAHTNFPSTAAFFQQASNDENIDLTRMDDTIKEHLSTCNHIEKDVISKWGFLSPSGSNTDETIKSLQRELQTVKEEATSTKAELARLIDSSPARTGPIKILQDRVILLEKTLGNQSSLLSEQTKNAKVNNERLASLASEMKKGAAQSPSQGAPSIQVQSDINVLKHKHRDVDSDIKALLKCQETVSKSIDQIRLDIEEQQRKLNNVNVGAIGTMEKRLDTSSHLTSLASGMARNPTQQANGRTDSTGVIKSMELRLKTLEDSRATSQYNKDQINQSMHTMGGKIDEMVRVQAMKDDLHFEEMEEIKKTLVQQNEEFKTLRDGYNQVSTDMKGLAQSNSAAALQQIQVLAGSLQGTQRVLETVKVGLHSLETRYNNISTEPIVKNMVVAMQEMYPSASQLTEQVTAMRNNIDQDILPLKSKVDHLIRSHSMHVAQMQRDAAAQVEEITQMRKEHARVDQSLAGLSERISTQGQLPTQQQFSQLQSKLESLAKRLNDHISDISQQMKSKQTSDESLVQSLNREREHFNKEFQRLSGQLKDLSSNFKEVATANMSSVETTKSHASDIRSLFERMRHLEESASNNHEQLLEQFEHIKKAVENQEDWTMDGQGIEEPPQSPQQKVEGDEELEEPMESPTNGEVNTDTAINHLAETNPALALREKKRKKKRPRPSTNASDDERPSEPQSGSNSPRMLTPGREGTPSGDIKKKSKKKKKRKLTRDTEPITLD